MMKAQVKYRMGYDNVKKERYEIVYFTTHKQAHCFLFGFRQAAYCLGKSIPENWCEVVPIDYDESDSFNVRIV